MLTQEDCHSFINSWHHSLYKQINTPDSRFLKCRIIHKLVQQVFADRSKLKLPIRSKLKLPIIPSFGCQRCCDPYADPEQHSMNRLLLHHLRNKILPICLHAEGKILKCFHILWEALAHASSMSYSSCGPALSSQAITFLEVSQQCRSIYRMSQKALNDIEQL